MNGDMCVWSILCEIIEKTIPNNITEACTIKKTGSTRGRRVGKRRTSRKLKVRVHTDQWKGLFGLNW